MNRIEVIIILWLAPLALWSQGPYAPAAGESGSDAIASTSSAIKAWGWYSEVLRGYIDIRDKPLGRVSFGESSYATGIVDGQVVSLGDSGVVVLAFGGWINNGSGFDFTVFENAFRSDNLELAFVEVSSDGQHFVRFPAVSLTPTDNQRAFADTLSPTNLHNLAGKYEQGYGVPFDLEELKGTNNLNVDSVTHVRIVDVVGSIDANWGTRDSQGNLINEPFPTPFETGGFDLDGIGVMNYTRDQSQTKPTAVYSAKPKKHSTLCYPNPVSQTLHFRQSVRQFQILNSFGSVVKVGEEASIDMSNLNPGFYWVKTEDITGKEETSMIVKQ